MNLSEAIAIEWLKFAASVGFLLLVVFFGVRKLK